VIARILAASAALLTLLGIPLSPAAPAGAADAGIAHPLRNPRERLEGGAARLSDEDREVLENLELLQRIDDWRDLDVLIEISKSS